MSGLRRVLNAPLLMNDAGEVVGIQDFNDGDEHLFVFQGDTFDIGSLVHTAVNHTQDDMTKGQAVYIAGAQGNRLSITLAQANSESASTKTFGLLYENIAKNANGWVVTEGMVFNIDTSAFAEGAVLWLSASTPGSLTTTRPTAPNHGVFVGVVVRSHHINGSIFVKVQNGFELQELHNVLITNPQNGDVIKYNASTGIWYNAQP